MNSSTFSRILGASGKLSIDLTTHVSVFMTYFFLSHYLITLSPVYTLEDVNGVVFHTPSNIRLYLPFLSSKENNSKKGRS